MRKRLTRMIPAYLLLLALLCGCAVQEYEKSALLPLPEDVDSSAYGNAGDGLLPSRIYHYEYTASGRMNLFRSGAASFGWSGDDETLYTVNGAPGEEVTVEKVDIRYGFHEVCASLGALEYEHLLLAPDGSRLVYDSFDEDRTHLSIFCYEIASGSTETILSLPWDINLPLEWQFAFTDDASRLFLWTTCTWQVTDAAYWYSGYAPEVLVSSVESAIDFIGALLEADLHYLTDVTEYTPSTGASRSIPLVYGTEWFYEDPYDGFPLLLKSVFPDCTGKTLAVCYTDQTALVDTASGSRLPSAAGDILYELFGVPEYLSALPRPYPEGSTFTEHYFCCVTPDTPLLLDAYREDSEPGSLYKLAESGLSLAHVAISHDETRLFAVFTSSSGESFVYLYPLPDVLNSDSPEGTLLYQTTDAVSSIAVSPDDRYILLRGMLSGASSPGVDPYAVSEEAMDLAEQYALSGITKSYKSDGGDETTAGAAAAGEGTEMEIIRPQSSAIPADYLVTILKL